MRYKPRRPRATLKLGDEALLRLTSAKAAEHFGVPNPISGRGKDKS